MMSRELDCPLVSSCVKSFVMDAKDSFSRRLAKNCNMREERDEAWTTICHTSAITIGSLHSDLLEKQNDAFFFYKKNMNII